MELFCTINPDESPFPMTLKEIKERILKDYPYDEPRFVLCREVAKNEHYHLYLKDEKTEYSDKTRNSVRRFLRELFKGEIRISKRQVENPIKAIAYTIKDGNYITHGIDWWTFIQAREVSHPKPKKFQGKLTDFYQNAMGKTEHGLICEVLTIFEECNIPIDTQRIIKIVRLALCKHNNNYRLHLIDRIEREL